MATRGGIYMATQFPVIYGKYPCLTTAVNGKQCISHIYNSCVLSEFHYSDVIMSTMASQIARVSIVYSAVRSGVDRRKYQSSASLAFVRGIHRWPVNSPHIWPVTRKMFPFDDVIMLGFICGYQRHETSFQKSLQTENCHEANFVFMKPTSSWVHRLQIAVPPVMTTFASWRCSFSSLKPGFIHPQCSCQRMGKWRPTL